MAMVLLRVECRVLTRGGGDSNVSFVSLYILCAETLTEFVPDHLFQGICVVSSFVR